MDALLRGLLVGSVGGDTLHAWWAASADRRGMWSQTIERALAGGACADRLGFAFASGYTEALRALVPGLEGISALCATEEGGNHPRAIRTALVETAPGSYTLSGRKKWATVAGEASVLLVVASTGSDGGKNRLRVVRVSPHAPGVTLRSTSAPFVPEIPHAEVDLEGVVVHERDVLPGDGYDDYLKPFRTVEDVHVHAALVGYLIGVARRRRFAGIESLLALAVATHALAQQDVKAATTHLALAGLIEQVTAAIGELERAWSADPDDEWTRWQRDRALLKVAGGAREARRARAWETI
jgi:acyl-CoA dehydrogenase